MNVHVIAVGKLKSGAYFDLWQEYNKRLRWPLTLTELAEDTQIAEDRKILSTIRNDRPLIVLDERGKSMKSRDFAGRLAELAEYRGAPLQFVIGGADGLSDKIRKKADILLAFGHQTWPHKMIRVMLIEQIYRAQTILDGHPYHRD